MSGPYPIEAIPTDYHGIQMRSRLEARVAAWMDSAGVRWVYEPGPLRSGAKTYTPDFQVGSRTYVEVKPWVEDGETTKKIARRLDRSMLITFDCVEGAFYWIVFSSGIAGLARPDYERESYFYQLFGWIGLCTSGHVTIVQHWESLRGTPSNHCQTCDEDISWLRDF